MQILKNIHVPTDLKQLSRYDLDHLASEIRDQIINVISISGGHLASNLGVVELAIALHYVFNSPIDKILWDVGHQAYAHKILTGRSALFNTIRNFGGLSGFTRLSESPHDVFSTGHSSTSISAALGMSCAKHLSQKKGSIVAVIGDGALTGGIAYEGLNQAGFQMKDLLIVLNDNNMSISPNVGAFSSFLKTSKSLRKINSVIQEIEILLHNFGIKNYNSVKLKKNNFKKLFQSLFPRILFTFLGIKYFGPIDGHNINKLIYYFKKIKNLKGPKLLHIKTLKGKGYRPAELNPVFFHGCGPFDINTGHCPKKENTNPTYTEIFGRFLLFLAEEDQRVVAISAAMMDGTGLVPFYQRFPDRFFDVGIAEQHAVTFAAGLALEGMRPIVAIYSTFLQRAYDQLVHDICLDAIPVVFVLDRGGIVGQDGPTHHGIFDLSYLRSMPNMVVMAPRNGTELCQMLKTAIDHKGPIALRFPRGEASSVIFEKQIKSIPMGKAQTLHHGHDVVILAIGRSVKTALDANKILIKLGIHATIVNCRFVKPLDTELICSLALKIPKFITVEENVLQGGFGSAVIECLLDQGIAGVRIKRVGVPDAFIEHGSQEELLAKYGLDAQAIADYAVNLVQGSKIKSLNFETKIACGEY